MAHARAERAQAVSGGSKMAEAPVFGLLLRMSLPLMLSMMIQALYNIVDSVFIGMLPERAEALQALGYASFATVAVYRRTMRESSAAPDSPAGTDAGTTPGTEGAHDPL